MTIDDAKNTFDTSIDQLLVTVDEKLAELEESYRTKVKGLAPKILEHLDGIEINTVLRGPVLTNMLNDAVSGANDVMSTGFKEQNFFINQQVENIQYDYRAGIELAVDKFNKDISALKDWTEEMTAHLEEVSTEVGDKIAATHTSFGDKVEACMTNIGDISSEESQVLSSQIDSWVKGRPMIHLTGFIQLPQALYRGESNRFRIGVANTGGEDWYGWIGMRLVLEDADGYVQGSWDYNSRPGKTPVLEADTTSVYSVDIGVPTEVDDGDMLTLFLLVNSS